MVGEAEGMDGEGKEKEGDKNAWGSNEANHVTRGCTVNMKRKAHSCTVVVVVVVNNMRDDGVVVVEVGGGVERPATLSSSQH